ncbi:nucleoside triphosphate pyrophosphohydrolase [Halothermothrix orenii]|uniref:MazG family protein n=1 Tax=Halothermothrix orenii (strain H 168 / OCM 544 / DSM 9562) TaxID=373903 RepID=B8D010_HALOH|nr:nucleoside triphosphate pyrophosphohydrolase [Halothermothrix orenii]ACL70862.1 MazG family protein [Halothermothrix orenii H 168]
MEQERLAEEFIRLVKIMERLRGPDGCPWDKKQDYYTLKPYIIEEAYEVVEALQKDDLELLKEELGDLLLQVVFESQIGKEKGDFNLIDVIKIISEKLIRRHPHVFGDEKVNTVSGVKVNWEKIKKQEKENKGREQTSILDDVSRSQPALNQAYDIQKKAAEVGFDWDNISDVVRKIEEELAEVKEVIKTNEHKEIEEELGDLIFAVVNLCRFYRINPEVALLRTILKFRDRFKYIEKRVSEEGTLLTDKTLEELDSYWEESKTME